MIDFKDSNLIRERLKAYIEENGIKPTPWGLSAGLSRNALSQFLNNPERNISATSLQKLADYEGVPIEKMLGANGSTASPVQTSTIKVIAPVRAGYWSDAFEYDLDDQDEIHIPEELAGNDNLFAVRVKGHSMDLEFPDNTILICISPYHLTTPIQDEDCVIVQRVRNGEYETTVKCLKIDENTGRAFLMPRSSKPEFQTPLIVPWPYMGKPDASTGLEAVEIIGVVLDSIRTRKLRGI